MASHNIQGGLGNKIQMDDVCNFINSNDIVCFQETWLLPSTTLVLPGYSIFRSDRAKSKRKHCGSGGVVVVYKTSLSKGLQKIKSENDDIVWVKLNKNFFGLSRDIYLCNCYIPPQKSELHDRRETSYFETLRKEIAKFQNMGHILLCGDFNARLGGLQERFEVIDCGDSLESDIKIEDFYVSPRFNEDKGENTWGKELLSILNESHLMVVNGRTLGDCLGANTCYTVQGSSTVDYFIVNPSLYSDILNMSVCLQTWYSDHSPLRMTLSIGRDLNETDCNLENLEKVSSYVWDDEGKDNFTNPVRATAWSSVKMLRLYKRRSAIFQTVKKMNLLADMGHLKQVYQLGTLDISYV